MARAKFMYKNTRQIIVVEGATKIAQCKKNDRYELLEEVKATRVRKPNVPKEITEE